MSRVMSCFGNKNIKDWKTIKYVWMVGSATPTIKTGN